MSSQHIEKITCPNCNCEGDFTIWDSINTELDPEMKERVRTGEVFEWVCPACGQQIVVNYSTLYHQMEDHIMVYLVFGDKKQAIDAMQGVYRDNSGKEYDIPPAFRLADDYRKRVVGTLNEFREKLMILDTGLDDRVIEIMKLYLIKSLTDRKPDLSFEEFYFNSTDFAVHSSDGKWGTVNYSQYAYDSLAEIFKDDLEKTSSDVVIDRNWAIDIITRHNS